MATLESISTSYSRKVQLEQFEPVEHSVKLDVSLDDGDDPDEVYDEYSDRAEEFVERAIVARIQAKKLAGDDEDD
jgi:hypothetical protein